jgi:hypothetical protein
MLIVMISITWFLETLRSRSDIDDHDMVQNREAEMGWQ